MDKKQQMKTRETMLKTYKSKLKGILNFKYESDDFIYQKKLTIKLDKLQNLNRSISQETINEIVLWKTDRYAELTPAAKKAINNPALRKSSFNKALTVEV